MRGERGVCVKGSSGGAKGAAEVGSHVSNEVRAGCDRRELRSWSTLECLRATLRAGKIEAEGREGYAGWEENEMRLVSRHTPALSSLAADDGPGRHSFRNFHLTPTSPLN